jgi:hypothetical protein
MKERYKSILFNSELHENEWLALSSSRITPSERAAGTLFPKLISDSDGLKPRFPGRPTPTAVSIMTELLAYNPFTIYIRRMNVSRTQTLCCTHG